MKKITISKNCNGEKYVSFPFFCNGKAVDGARWGMTLRSAGSMRFRWNETNEKSNTDSSADWGCFWRKNSCSGSA
ncbi:MAG: hypothetical protein SOT45_00325 [Treponema sp.]|nr:hypothetical protein [Treponema sp.]